MSANYKTKKISVEFSNKEIEKSSESIVTVDKYNSHGQNIIYERTGKMEANLQVAIHVLKEITHGCNFATLEYNKLSGFDTEELNELRTIIDFLEYKKSNLLR